MTATGAGTGIIPFRPDILAFPSADPGRRNQLEGLMASYTISDGESFIKVPKQLHNIRHPKYESTSGVLYYESVKI